MCVLSSSLSGTDDSLWCIGSDARIGGGLQIERRSDGQKSLAVFRSEQTWQYGVRDGVGKSLHK